jgi:hypothetical protein
MPQPADGASPSPPEIRPFRGFDHQPLLDPFDAGRGGAAGSSYPESSATASVAAMTIGISKREGALKRV